MTYQYCKNLTVTYKYLQVHIMIAKQDKLCEQALVIHSSNLLPTCTSMCPYWFSRHLSYLPTYLPTSSSSDKNKSERKRGRKFSFLFPGKK